MLCKLGSGVEGEVRARVLKKEAYFVEAIQLLEDFWIDIIAFIDC